MQNGAEMCTCAQAGAVIYLLSYSICCLGVSTHLWDTLFISGILCSSLHCGLHLCTYVSWTPHIWNLMVPFEYHDTALELFSHSDSLRFWLALEKLVGNLVINPEGSYVSFKSQVRSLPPKFQVSGHVWAQSNELSLSLFVCQLSELSKLVSPMQIYKMSLP